MDKTIIYFGMWDYAVFGSVLVISAGIGIYFRMTGGRQKSMQEYLFANKDQSFIPVAFSLMASFMSAITLLGTSRENYMFGTQYFLMNVAYLLGTPIVCYLYFPVFFHLQNVTVYEYLERRFGWLTRLFASLAFSIQMILYMGIVLYAPALALSAVTGISQTWGIFAVGIVCTFYSTLGGMKAVLITDVFQTCLMFAAILAVVVRGLIDLGFWNIIEIAYDTNRLEFFNVSINPKERHTVWNLAFGGIFIYCSLYGINQTQVQRLLTMRSLSQARAALWIQWVLMTLLSLLTCFSGLIMYAHYSQCDPVLSGRISASDQLLPLYFMETMGFIPGLPGLFVSGIFSGSLSSVSSIVNSLAAVTIQDLIKPCLNKYMDDRRTAVYSKLLSCAYGVICMAVAFCSQLLGTGVLQAALTIFGAVGGPLLALFTLGMTCRCANQKGVLIGLTFGLILTLWIGFGHPKPTPPVKKLSVQGCSMWNATKVVTLQLKPEDDDDNFLLKELYAVSYAWVASIGFFTSLILGIFVSALSGGNVVVDPELYFPCIGRSIRRQQITQLEISKDIGYQVEDSKL